MKKNIVLLALIVISLSIGYFLRDFFNEDFTFSSVDELSLSATSVPQAQPISEDKARSLIKEYQDKQKGFFHIRPLKTAEDSLLKGFFIDTGTIKKIISQDGCNGIRVYIAKHDSLTNTKKRIYTLIFVGTAKNGTNGIKGNLSSSRNPDTNVDLTNIIYEHVDPCPTNC
jgi:hypothetical protein